MQSKHFSGKKSRSLKESDTWGAGIAAFKAAGVDGESIGSQLVWIGQKIVSGVVQITNLYPGSGPYREDRGRVANHRLGSHDRLTIV